MRAFPALGTGGRSSGEASRGSEVTRTTIGHYEVVRKLATGGMGEVYLAHQKGPVDFRRQVVLKRLHPKHNKDPQFVAMFLNEARIAGNLTHPNIIHIYELFEDGQNGDDGYVIAMEYVRGGTVLGLLRGLERAGESGLPYGPLIRIATSVCDALYYAYNEPDPEGVVRRVIHRDVNPSNVLVGFDGQVKLADFGIAKALEEEGVTQATTIKGKYGYLTPEQIRCHALDQRSDLFSLGTMLWEMSVGRRLFQRDNEMQMLYAILEERIPLPSEIAPGYPPDLERVVMRALARSRDERYPDARALADDLHAVARAHGWDEDQATLQRLVKGLLPDNQVAFGQIGSDPFAQAIPGSTPGTSGVRRRDSATGNWADGDSFASMVVIDTAARAAAAAKANRWLTRANLVTVMILLAASAAFWLWIVPQLDA